ncbi:MAG: hypothetical protein IH596_05290 [Bacteroidales bacterium]|nr:hypothetical protein [Bacteroidales bacterium]
MKKIIFVLGFLMATSICVEGHNHYNNQVSISIQTFYNELAPYGEWIYTPEYGYAWKPYLNYNEDFQPYSTRGNWVYTDLGWTWVSEYRWGWATFHYGRWYFDDYFGWMWLPGYEWAPAWVTWGSYDTYWAWAPMGPNMYVNVNYSWRPPSFWWTFVPFRHFCAYNWHSYIYDRPVQVNNITYINNYYYGNDDRHNTWTWDNGPRVPDVERHTQTKVQKRTIVDSDKPVGIDAQANQVKVYRPGVTKNQEEARPANYRTVERGKTDTRTTDQGKVSTRTTEPGKINTRTTDPGKITPRTQPATRQTTETTTKQNTQRVAPTTSQRNNVTNRTTSTTHTQVKPPVRESTPTRTQVKPPVRESTTTRTQVKPPVRESTTTHTAPNNTGTKSNTGTKGKPSTQPTPRSK